MSTSSRTSRLWFKRNDETSFPTSPEPVTFTRCRSRSHTEGTGERARRRERERTTSNASSKPWAKLAARFKSLSGSSAAQGDNAQYIQRRSQTPSADHLTEMMRRHQLQDAERERRDHPFLKNRVSRSASSASQRSLRPPPRRLSTQSSRSDLTQLEPGSCLVTPITPSSSQFGAPLPPPTPPGSAHPSPTAFSPPERIRRSWSGHPFAARQPGYTPESSETWSDYAPDVGTLCSVPEFERTPSFEPPRSPPPDHPFMCKRGIPRNRRGTFGANEASPVALDHDHGEYAVWR